MISFIGFFRFVDPNPITFNGLYRSGRVIIEVRSPYPNYYLSGFLEHVEDSPIGAVVIQRYLSNFNQKREFSLSDREGLLVYTPYRRARSNFVAQAASFWYAN